VLDFATHLGNGNQSVGYDASGILAMSSRDHLFVRYDGRGSGLSTREITDFSLKARVGDIKAVVDALNLDRFDLLGVSAGGPPAIAFAAQYPERVKRLVLAGAMASSQWMDDEKRESWERMLDLFEVDWNRPETSNLMASMMLSPNNDAFTLQLVGELMRRSTDGHMMARFFREQFSIDNTTRAKAIRVPTLVIHASDDAAIDLEAGLELAELIPGSLLEIVEGGHFVGSGGSIAVRRRILDFFEAEN
jgi:pimeloyl-ACP methyl ester carboxylesterase